MQSKNDQADSIESSNMNEIEQSIDGANSSDQSAKPPGFSRLLLDMLFCIAIPVFILRKYSGDDSLGPSLALIVALAFPLMTGIFEFIKDKKVGLMASIGFISILLTGGIGVLKLPKEYIAIKEALVPLGFGLAVLFSTFTSKPLVRTFIYNDMFMETEKVAQRLSETNQSSAFDALMVKATWILAASFLLSSILNYVLAKIIIVSETGTEAFNQEFSTMTLLSWPVIALPSTIVTMYAMYFVFTRILRMTGFELEEILRQ
ncbi:MAG: intracellular septation protein A [Cryomorphaceae bacterium]|jgi:intracellular septation protein A